MQKTFDLEVDGLKFQCLPLPLTTRLRLDKQLLTLLSPVAKTISTAPNELIAAVQAMPEVFQNLPDADFLQLVSITLQTTTAITSDKGALSLAEEMNREAIFDKLTTLYKLMVEIWRQNKLTVFVLAANRSIGG